MNVITVSGIILVCFLCFDPTQCFFEIVPWAVGALSALVPCQYSECCTDEYIPGDLNLLDSTLKNELYGQHLAIETVRKALEDHIHNAESKKPLAMSFHGSSGVGKNHMVNLIVDALYKNGAKSKYVHHYNGYLNFHDKEKVAEYQAQLEKDIQMHLQSCSRSIFIFDGVDHMPDGMLDVVLKFLDYNPRVLAVNPTKAIFIFVSNTGAPSIEDKLIQIWETGTKRETIKLEDFESILALKAYDAPGGFHESDLVKMNFIDHYIPFLPLEKIHVTKCINAAFGKRDLEKTDQLRLTQMTDEVMAHMKFAPDPQNLYSESGCKRVDSKVSAIFERSRFTNPAIP